MTTPRTPTTINVSGSSTLYRPAERCQVSLSISSTGPSASECSSRVTALTNDLSARLRALAGKDEEGETEEEAGVTWWSMSRLSSSSWVPNRQEGQRGLSTPERMYRTTTHFTAKFRDFEELSKVVGNLSKQEDISIDSLSWHLTEMTRDSLRTQVRQGAFRDAYSKAQDYAAVLAPSPLPSATHSLVCKEVNDGHSSVHSNTAFGRAAPRMRKMKMAGAARQEEEEEAISFEPESVGVTAEVTCVFELHANQ